MTSKVVVAFDPGYITGLSTGIFSEDKPVEIVYARSFIYPDLLEDMGILPDRALADYVVSEVFESRANQEFAPDLTGVRVEGLLDLVYGSKITWRSPSKKSQVPDSILQRHDLWYTGSQVEWEDGRDVNDAIIHLLGFVAFDLNHRPTQRKYFR
jgi:hypothetical protein